MPQLGLPKYVESFGSNLSIEGTASCCTIYLSLRSLELLGMRACVFDYTDCEQAL